MGSGKEKIFVKITLLFGIIISSLICSLGYAHGAEFTADTIGDFGNITVMEVAGNYDAGALDAPNSMPRQEIAKEFYKTHSDDYDFLVIFSNFDFQMPESEAVAFYSTIRNDTQGIGAEIFDSSSFYGSNGKLQGAIDMGNLGNVVSNPFDPLFSFTLGTLSHELLHRWAARSSFIKADGSISSGLLGQGGSHWSFLLDTAGSLEYGNRWVDNSDGTFTSLPGRKYFSPLDLYLMGFLDKSQVPPMLLIENSEVDPAQVSQSGVTISGAATTVTIDDIIAADGERVPSYADSQKNFKIGCIFITQPGTYVGDELSAITNIMNAWPVWFSSLTGGVGKVAIDVTPIDTIPSNPGVIEPVVDPRTTGPEVYDGVVWLQNNQQANGSWQDVSFTAGRDTAEAVAALAKFSTAISNISDGVSWLTDNNPTHLDFLARKIEVMALTGNDTSVWLTQLLDRQNPDGGWGSQRNYISNPSDTALSLRALGMTNALGDEFVSKAVQYLQNSQHADGGWGNDDQSSMVATTVDVLMAFEKLLALYDVSAERERATTWLLSKQNTDGGFGNSPSTIYNTAATLMALKGLGLSGEAPNKALAYLLNMQTATGSWAESPYQTALAIEAIWQSTQDPDIVIPVSEIVMTPAVISQIPSTVTLAANVWNTGLTDVADVKVALYIDVINDTSKIAEQIISLAGQSSLALTFDLDIIDGDTHRYYLVADPDNVVEESSETNNTVLQTLYPDATYDFEVTADDLLVTPSTVDLLQNLIVSATVRNSGTRLAYSVPVRYSVITSGGQVDIATVAVDIPAGSSVTKEIVWRADQVGSDMDVVVTVDPDNSLIELVEDNNSATSKVTVKAATDPNLTVNYQDITITPTPASQGDHVIITALIKNQGFSTANNITVEFYVGVPGVDGVLFGSQVIPSLNATESSTVGIDWQNIPEPGEKVITVVIDPANSVPEIAEDDNSSFVTLPILNLPDFAVNTSAITFLPAAPKDGDVVTIQVMVQNLGEQGRADVAVTLYEGESVVGTEIIPFFAGNSQQELSFTYDTLDKSGSHQFSLVVDEQNLVVEQLEDNNKASRLLGVQNADLWLSERYISPNGDGVQDNTEFFFRLETAQTVRVEVVNSSVVVERTFDSGDFEETQGSTLTWDGLADKGTVVADGEYQIRVVDVEGSVLMALPVTVDINRVSVTAAVGTEYLYKKRLVCTPELTSWKNYPLWFKDGSGIYLGGSRYDETLSTINVGEGTIVPITSPELENFSVDGAELAPGGSKVVYWGARHIDDDSGDLYELWVVDRNGKGVLLWSSNSNSINMVSWAANSRTLACRTLKNDRFYWFTVSVDEGGITEIPAFISSNTGEELHYDGYPLRWSPDGQYLFSSHQAANGDHFIRTMSPSLGQIGEMQITGSRYYGENYWLGTKFLAVSYYGSDGYPVFSLIDPKQPQVQPVEIDLGLQAGTFMRFHRIEVSPDQSRFSIHLETEDVGDRVFVCDRNGSCEELEDNSPLTNEVWQGLERMIYSGKRNITDVRWASEERVAYVNHMYVGESLGRYDGIFDGHLVIFDLKAGEKEDYQVSNDVEEFLIWAWGGEYNYDTHDLHGSHTWPNDPVADPVFLKGGSLHHNGNAETLDETGVFWQTPNSVHWLDESTISGRDEKGLFAINVVSGEKAYLDLNFQGLNYSGLEDQNNSGITIAPGGGALAYQHIALPGSPCYTGEYGNVENWLMGSYLNLTVDLRILKQDSAVLLKGTAADLNFLRYSLEYADLNDPENWQQIMLPSQSPTVDSEFTWWVPPHEGVFAVRLTVDDKAGNKKQKQEVVTWGKASSVTGLYLSDTIFSPNNDGVKDTVALNYRVNEAVHLEFLLFDERGALIRTLAKEHAMAGEVAVTWDGRDEFGEMVPDGLYRFKLFDFAFQIEVDNTSPEIGFEFSPLQAFYSNYSQNFYADCTYGVDDENLKNWRLEYASIENPEEWFELVGGMLPVINEKYSFRDEYLEMAVNYVFRLVAEDYAGNSIFVERTFLDEQLFFNAWEMIYPEKQYWQDFPIEGQDVETGYELTTSPGDKLRVCDFVAGVNNAKLFETIRKPLQSVTFQYAMNGQWYESATGYEPFTSGGFDVSWDVSALDVTAMESIRIHAIDVDGKEYFSNQILIDDAACGSKITGPMVSCQEFIPAQLHLNIVEPLKQLRFQVLTGTVQGDWQDYYLIDDPVMIQFFQGQDVPFTWFPDPAIYGTGDIRVIAESLAGKLYVSAPASIESLTTTVVDEKEDCPEDVDNNTTCQPGGPSYPDCLTNVSPDGSSVLGTGSLSVLYLGVESCNSISSDVRLVANFSPIILEEGGQIRGISFAVYVGEQWQNIGYEPEVLQAEIIFDSKDLAEGEYVVQAMITVEKDGIVTEFSASEKMRVDRTLPPAEIIQPAHGIEVCSQAINSLDEQGVVIEALTSDGMSSTSASVLLAEGVLGDFGLSTKTTTASLKQTLPDVYAKGIAKLPVAEGDEFTARLTVTDSYNNQACSYSTFTVDSEKPQVVVHTDLELFSPGLNRDGIADDLILTPTVNENVTLDIVVYQEATKIRTIVNGYSFPKDSTDLFVWSGRDDNNDIVLDGNYTLRITAADRCGHTTIVEKEVEVDNTAPALLINSPIATNYIGIVQEVRGEIQDPHLQEYKLWVENNGTVLADKETLPPGDILGVWNTADLEPGEWTIRLSATDYVGNSSEISVAVNIGERPQLIKDFKVTPAIISPDANNVLDTADIEYLLAVQCDISFFAINEREEELLIGTAVGVPAGAQKYEWDGMSAGIVVPDGLYQLKILAVDATDPSNSQEETVSLIVDTISPVVDLTQPLDGSVLKGNDNILGSVTDANLKTYSLVIKRGDLSEEVLATHYLARVDYPFASLSGLEEGEFVALLSAEDHGGNTAEIETSFVIDRTPPLLTLTSPLDGSIFGPETGSVPLLGTILETNLQEYSIRYGAGNDPAEWTTIVSGTTLPAGESLGDWQIDADSILSEGLYTVSFVAIDLAGWQTEIRQLVTVDTTPPLLSFSQPLADSYVVKPMIIEGTATDANLAEFVLDLGEGTCDAAVKWLTLTRSEGNVDQGTLANWRLLPADGNYCLRLSAADTLGNASKEHIDVMVDTIPPAALVLSGVLDDQMNARLSWEKSSSSDVVEYRLYRDDVLLTAVDGSIVNYTDELGIDRIYQYAVTAVDAAGLESELSNKVEIYKDTTPPKADIFSPRDGDTVQSLVNITGTVVGSDDLKEYNVFVGHGVSPDSWQLLRTSSVPVNVGELTDWNTFGLPAGENFTIRLEAEDLAGNVSSDHVIVTVDNDPPAAPLLLSVEGVDDDVNLTWAENQETDLAGYLVHRNHELVNVTGPVSGSLLPYLVTGTVYLDQDVPDGVQSYQIAAMDEAGNVSALSNAISVIFDNHPPQALIVSPADGNKFQNALTIIAESADTDIASVQFQFEKDGIWFDLGEPVPTGSYLGYLDPVSLALVYGDYSIRAVATDGSGKVDEAPEAINVTYTDITPPAPPQDLKATAKEGTVQVTWIANTDEDLVGYNLYQIKEDARVKLNSDLLVELSFLHVADSGDLPDDGYSYELCAVDDKGNESRASRAEAVVFTPIFEVPFAYTKDQLYTVTGKAVAGAEVKLFAQQDGEFNFLTSVPSTAGGGFAAELALSKGENTIMAQAIDGAGNISKKSATMLAVWNTPPAQPLGLQAIEQDFNVSLTWQPNSDQDLAGYKLYRNNVEMQKTELATAQSIAVSSYRSYPGTKAYDNNLGTYWLVNNRSEPYTFDWWEITFPQAELVSSISLDWLEGYGAIDFEIQVWSGGDWLTLHKVADNVDSKLSIDFGFAYLTEKVRVYITRPQYTDSRGAWVYLTEVRIHNEVVLAEPSFGETVGDGIYRYKVSAVDQYGLESELSDYVQVEPVVISDPTNPLPSNGILSTMPTLTYPTVTGQPVTWGDSVVDLVGLAEAGATVELNMNDQNIGATVASSFEDENSYPMQIDGTYSTRYSAKRFNATYTADGQIIYYDHFNNVTKLFEMSYFERETGKSGFIEGVDAWLSNISPDGKTLIICAEDEDYNWHLMKVDTATGEKKFLHESTGEDTIYEEDSSWSRDGSTLAYVNCDMNTWDCGFMLIDHDTGIEQSLMDVTDGDWTVPRLSPDGSKVAFLRYFSGADELKVVDVATKQVTSVSDEINGNDYWVYDWAPDGKTIVYLAVVDDVVEIREYDLSTEESSVIPFYDGVPQIVRYDADGRSLIIYSQDVWPYSVWRVPIGAPEGSEQLMISTAVIKNLHVGSYGEIFYLTDYELHTYNPAGQFVFKDVPLHSGENVFTAQAKDDIGYTGEPSQPITIIRDDSQFADLEVLTDDIFTYPYTPMVGDEIEVAVVARNNGPAVENVGIEIYVLDANGYIDLVDIQTIPYIGEDEEALVETYFDSDEYAGLNTLYVRIDPDNSIIEASEVNNEAYAPWFVASYEGFDFDVAVDKAEVGAADELPIALHLFNGDPEQDVSVAVNIEDENGISVVNFDPYPQHLLYAEFLENNLTWNTASTYAGTYQVHGKVFGSDGSLLREEIVPFTIEPTDCLEAALTLTKTSFGPYEDVALAGDLNNCGSNYNQPQLTARFSITDGLTELHSQVVDLPWLLADSKARVKSNWNTALHSPGDYTAQLEVIRDNEVRVTAIQSLTIEPVVKLSGSVNADPSVTFLGRPVSIDYAVANNGNAPADALELMVLVQDATTGTLITEATESLTLAVSASHVNRLDLNASLFKLGNYNIMLQADRAGEITTLATDTLLVKDGTPPVVVTLSPIAAEIYNGPLSLAVNATDNATGVELVEYSFDGVTWLPLPAVAPGSTRYAKTWSPSEDDEGNRQVRFRATDGVGNVSDPVSVDFVVELKTPFEKLTGTLSVSPETAYQGEELRLPVTIDNVSKKDLAGIIVRVLIINPVDNSTVATLDKEVSLSALTTYPDSFSYSSLELAAQEYRAVLQVISPEEGSRDLAVATFVVRPSLAVESHVTSPLNLLVWINSWCKHHHHRHQEHEQHEYSHDDEHEDGKHHHRCTKECFITPDCTADCPRLDLLEEILIASTNQYRLVFDRESFEGELRNPLFTDILILGDQKPLSGHFDEELREKVYSGTGLIVSGWQSHKFFGGHEEEDVLGLENKGTLASHQQEITINTLASAITDPDSFIVNGKVAKVDTQDDALVAAWANYQVSCPPPKWGWSKKKDDNKTKTEQTPAVVLHSYGLASTLYYGFDLLANLDEMSYPQLSELLERSLDHIHTTSGDMAELYPYQLLEVERRVTSLGDLFPIKVTETSSPELLLFNPESQQWVMDNPWILTMDLEPQATVNLPFYVILPDLSGLFNTSTDIGFFIDSSYVPFANLLAEFDIGQDRDQLVSTIIAKVQALPVTRKETGHVRSVGKYLTKVANRTVLQAKDISKNIHDIEKAVNALLHIDSIDIHQIRLQLDRLLRIEQGRFYFFVPPLDNLTGTLTGPGAALQVRDTGHFVYTINNDQDVHLDKLKVRLRLSEASSCWPDKEKEEIKLPALREVQGEFVVKTKKSKAGIYEAILEVGLDDDDHFRELARITFEII